MTAWFRHGRHHVWVHVVTLVVAFTFGFAAAATWGYVEFQTFKAAHTCQIR